MLNFPPYFLSNDKQKCKKFFYKKAVPPNADKTFGTLTVRFSEI